jgi:hypothetical protein
VVRERTARRERVLDRRKLSHLLRHLRAIAVIEVLAEEILVVRVVPAVGLLRLGFGLDLVVLGGLRFGGLDVLDGDFLEHRVLDHLLRQQVAKLERGHRQQLDGLLQRRRQNQLLNELRVEFLRNGHGRRRTPRRRS